MLGLMMVPFIDRNVMIRVRQRTLAVGVVALAALGWGGLTAAAIRSTPPTPQIDVTAMTGLSLGRSYRRTTSRRSATPERELPDVPHGRAGS